MAQVHTSPIVKVIPKDGELEIKLDITINVVSESVSVLATEVKKKEEEESKFVPIIPDFGTGKVLNFGKSVEKEK